jgi:hypothetical protein
LSPRIRDHDPSDRPIKDITPGDVTGLMTGAIDRLD